MLALMPNRGLSLCLSPTENAQLQTWGSAPGTAQQVSLRCQIVLAAAAGEDNVAIAHEEAVSRPTMQLWRRRVREGGIGEVWEIAPGTGRKPKYDRGKVEQIVKATLHCTPRGRTQWSTRAMAQAQGVSKDSVNRVWQRHNLKPHPSRAFKPARGPQRMEELNDVVGLYLNPPDKAIVLCLDDSTDIQALDRTQPGVPLQQGRSGPYARDSRRNGTSALLAALSLLDGRVFGEWHTQQRRQEWLRFLRRLDRELPPDLALHLVLDTYGIHQEAHGSG